MKALEEENGHSHISCRRACQAVRGCTSAAPSVPLGCGLGLRLVYPALPKEITAGPEQSAPVFPKPCHAARAGCRPSTSCLPNSCACHGAAVTSQACRATRRRIRSRAGGQAPPFLHHAAAAAVLEFSHANASQGWTSWRLKARTSSALSPKVMIS